MSDPSAPLQWIRSLAPPHYVNSAAISGDGSVVVAGTFYHVYAQQRRAGANGEQGTFGTYCFDRSGTRLWADTFEGWQGVYWVALSRDSQWAASGGWFSQNPYAGFVSAYRVANGEKALQFATGGRVNALALSGDGSSLVAACEDLLLFTRSGDGFGSEPARITLPAGNTAETVAISQDGRWVAYGDYAGNVVLVANDGGAFGASWSWSLPGGGTVHCVTMSDDGEWIAVGASGGAVHLLNRARLQQGGGAAWSQPLPEGGSIYYAAVSADGAWVTAVVNSGQAGAVYLLANHGDHAETVWRNPTPRNPNSTSMDAAGTYVAVADGHPDGTPGHFLLFDRASGRQLWSWTTPNMSWPMFLSADGSGVVAGSDDSSLLYFTPTAPVGAPRG